MFNFIVLLFQGNNYQCKLLTSFVQYFTLANYSWILMEGLYLNNLIWRALFADSSRNLIYYICFGWGKDFFPFLRQYKIMMFVGLPFLVIIPWIVTRIFLDDSMCWTTNDNLKAYLIIVIPTMIAVLVSYGILHIQKLLHLSSVHLIQCPHFPIITVKVLQKVYF